MAFEDYGSLPLEQVIDDSGDPGKVPVDPREQLLNAEDSIRKLLEAANFGEEEIQEKLERILDASTEDLFTIAREFEAQIPTHVRLSTSGVQEGNARCTALQNLADLLIDIAQGELADTD
ncbi:MAG: hypothetical protein WC107_01065 [Patescibacteria group bacterium]